ncbi:taste receptor type 2 member 9-like [Rhynchocyon petersi]
MLTAVEITYMILTAGELAVGIWGNGFIVLVNCIGCFKRKDVNLIDIILVSLASSRICLLCVISLDGFIMVLFPNTYTNGEIMSILDVLWTLSNHLSVWFTSCLSIFYLLKITTISHLIFLWLRQNINKVILGILLGSVLVTLLICISTSYNLHDDFRYKVKENDEENVTWEFEVSKTLNALQQIFLNLGALVPFILSMISFLFLLFSLFRHIKQMKLHATGSRDPSTEAHMRAIKAVAIILLLFIISYILFLVVTSSLLIPQRKLVVMLGGITAIIFPSGHSLILIMGNSKLKEAFLKVVRFVKAYSTLCSIESPRETPE